MTMEYKAWKQDSSLYWDPGTCKKSHGRNKRVFTVCTQIKSKGLSTTNVELIQ